MRPTRTYGAGTWPVLSSTPRGCRPASSPARQQSSWRASSTTDGRTCRACVPTPAAIAEWRQR
eukprot:5083502-Prymnesium_polylepis.1